jgi:hypothetical protein
MKKILSLSILFLITSCGVLKNTAKDPYVGTFDFTIFEVDNFGDIPVKLTLNKEGEGYTSQMETTGDSQAAGALEINSTTFENGVMTIEAYTSGYDIYFELTVEGDEISGSMMGMFEVEGTRVKE